MIRWPACPCRAKKKQHGRVSEFLQRLEKNIQSRGLLPRGAKNSRRGFRRRGFDGAASRAEFARQKNRAGKFPSRISTTNCAGAAATRTNSLSARLPPHSSCRSSVERADVKQFAKESKISIEMAARKLRHEFFARVAREAENFHRCARASRGRPGGAVFSAASARRGRRRSGGHEMARAVAG